MNGRMRVGQLRRLALVVQPVPGEALVSWLNAMAAEYGITRNQAAHATGIVNQPADLKRIPDAAFDAAEVAGDLWTTCRLTPQQTSDMTYHRFRGTAMAPLGPHWVPTTSRQSAEAWWINANWLRLCPLCAADTGGRWPLSWTLPWVFACPAHRCYLVDTCPRCQSSFPALTTNPAQGVCRARRLDDLRGQCGMPLRDLPVVPVEDEELLQIQQRLLERLDAPAAERPQAHADFRDLWAMACLALYTATAEHLPGADPFVADAFDRFCHEHPAAEGRWLPYGRRLRPPLPVTAAIIRIAAGIVFSPDPFRAADAVADLSANPHSAAIILLHKAWRAGPLTLVKRGASARVEPVMNVLRYEDVGFAPRGFRKLPPGRRKGSSA